ncbi:MAG: hypothetical protein IT422_04340 [Pirellulaceae bacterium]|nr:hypothetical protein [Pirellulaceae bacterium]
MRVIQASCFGLLLSFTVASLAFAQGGAVTAPPIVNWSYVGHSSTAGEGYLRGSAAVIQSAGQANYLNSIAAVNYQEATRKLIENHDLYVRNAIQSREMVHEFRERYRPSAPTPEEWQRVTEASLPDRLTSDQFDPITGKLIWPHILRTEEYRAFRERVDAIVSNRTPDNSGNGSPSQRELASLIDGMKMLLKSNINTVTLSQYASAKWFLKSVDYEAQFPLQSLPATTDVGASELVH